jgi:acyl transferase domain-containing protein/NADPH-dependent curcumin reductase CurA/NADP-dependent 3-hydroxy acid dehydrogenase YdfG/acyl carrier protein
MRRALVAIRDLRRRVEELEGRAREPVAIVGMSCRFPGGATTPERFWQLMRDGIDATVGVPSDRWDADAIYDPDPEAPGRSYVRRAGFLREPVDRFDPMFFGISPREAAAMDPMQRMLLELTWEALERAAIPAHTLEGSDTGVYIGMSGSDYDVLQRENITDINSYRGTGTISSVAAGRISHLLGLHGPNVALDTACSSVLVALALAVDAIRTGRSRMALAGTAHLMLSPEGTIMLCKLRALSAEGRCRTFDAEASGYARAEGGGMFVLKKLSDAITDGDPVLAVIHGVGVNHDGRSSGLTVPNPGAQRAVIQAALRDAGLTPAAVSYVEAHGTGTPLGDPIELRALADVLGPGRTSDQPLWVGSVKTNVGHLEPAAGAAGLAKVVLSLQHRQIPAHLHLQQPTPHVPWDRLGLRVPTTLMDWSAEPRYAGISGFGFSGTNAHIIVGEAPARAPDARPTRPVHLIALSGRSRAAVRDLATSYHEHIDGRGDGILPDLAVTTTTGRTALPFRAIAVGADAVELSAALHDVANGSDDHIAQFKGIVAPPLAMMFTGQGAQYPAMAQELWETAPAFRTVLQQCADIVEGHLDRPLLPLLLEEGEAETLRQTQYTQPALFALEYALAALWRSWGVEPAYVLGHSLGEYVAATVAGVLDIEHALPLIALRGRLMQQLPAGGRMVAVATTEARVAEAIDGLDPIAIAAVNAPESIVLSGSSEAVAAALGRLPGVKSKDLEVSHAFHSPLMEPVLAEFERAIAALPLRAPTTPLISNLTGDVLTPDDAVAPARWRRHIRETVRFSDSLQRLAALGVQHYLEVGPHPTLCGLGAQTLPAGPRWLPSLRRAVPAWKQLATTAGELFRSGFAFDWERWSADFAGRRVETPPTYPFQRERYWFSESTGAAVPPAATIAVAAVPAARHPLLGAALQSPALDGWAFQTELEPNHPHYLVDHRLQGSVVVCASAFIEMMVAGAAEGPAWPQASLSDIAFEAPLLLPDDGRVTCQVLVGTPRDGSATVRVVSAAAGRDGTRWITHARATAHAAAPAMAPVRGPEANRLRVLQEAIDRPFDPAEFYRRLEGRGIAYGPAFRGLREIRTGEGEALGRAELIGAVAAGGKQYTLHPCTLDMAFQLLESLMEPDAADAMYLPAGIDRVEVYGQVGDRCWIHAKRRPDQPVADLFLYDAQARLVAALHGFHALEVRGALDLGGDAELLFHCEWEPVEPPAAPPTDLAGTWLLLEDGSGVGTVLAGALHARGGHCLRVRRSSRENGDDVAADAVLSIDPSDPAAWQRVADAVHAAAGPLRGVLHLWSLDRAPAEDASGKQWLDHALDLTTTLPELLRGNLLAGADHGLRVLTSGAEWPVGQGAARGLATEPTAGPATEPTGARLAGAAVRSMLNVLRAEHPTIASRAVDAEQLRRLSGDRLLALLLGSTPEDRLVVRDGVTFAPRLTRISAADASGTHREIPDGDAYRIDVARRGTLDAIRYVAAERREPAVGEVEVRVRTTGLNFRDVLNVLGTVPGVPGPPGVEFAGVVTRVGSGVANVQVGSEVIGLGEGTFAAYVTTPAAAIAPMPSALTAVEAATLPLAFLTAEWGLADLAGMKAGERVLIHAAAGGVGQAAVQLAQAAGARVFATAGSDEKRDYLRRQGVEHVFDSRSASFADDILAVTAGEGVDVVLNSLTGELLQRSLELLRPGGRFIEIGKAEILDKDVVAARHPAVRYHAFDLGAILLEQPATFQSLFQRVLARFAAGELQPLPARVFAAEDVVDAFRYMAQAKHIGKVVVAGGRITRAPIRADGVYVVTGASGGVARSIIEWLVAQGAGRIVLNARSEAPPELREWLECVAGSTRIDWHAGDVSERLVADELIAHAAGSALRVRGVFHCAGVLDDGLLHEQTRARFARVMAPKIAGAWNLHCATRTLPELDHFVLFSSIAAQLGGPGQGNYAAANGFLGALALRRRQQGLPGTAIEWGAWGGAGMATRLSDRELRLLTDHGLGFLAPDRAMNLMQRVLDEGRSHVLAAQLNWQRVTARTASPLLQRMRQPRDIVPDAGPSAPRHRTITTDLATLTATERQRVLGEYLGTTLGAVLGVRTGALTADAEIAQFGFDSLMAMELRNRIEADLGLIVPVSDLLECATPEELAGRLTQRMGEEEPAGVGATDDKRWEEGEI